MFVTVVLKQRMSRVLRRGKNRHSWNGSLYRTIDVSHHRPKVWEDLKMSRREDEVVFVE
jgi:hypothetical protein